MPACCRVGDIIYRIEPEAQAYPSRRANKGCHISRHVVPLVIINQVGFTQKLRPRRAVIGRNINERSVKSASFYKQQVVKTHAEGSELSGKTDGRRDQVRGIPCACVVVTGCVLTIIECVGSGMPAK